MKQRAKVPACHPQGSIGQLDTYQPFAGRFAGMVGWFFIHWATKIPRAAWPWSSDGVACTRFGWHSLKL